MSANAHKERAPNPSEPFDFNAVPTRFYLSAEGVGAIPVKDVIERGLDILTDNLADVIIAINRETGADMDDGDDGLGAEMQDPEGYANGMNGMNGMGGMGGANGYDAGGYGGGMGGYEGGYGGAGGGGYGLNR